MKAMIATMAMLLLLVPPVQVAKACVYDLDCAVGSKCLHINNSFDGVCVGGLYPGNRYDSDPYRPRSRGVTTGRQCTFDLDCSVGSICFKTDRFSMYGTCIER